MAKLPGTLRSALGIAAFAAALAFVARWTGRRRAGEAEQRRRPARVPISRRLGRLPLILGPASLLAGLALILSVVAPALLNNSSGVTYAQPIQFDHKVHVQQAGLTCAYCHRTASQGVTAGYPDVQLCMQCHQTVGAGQPEVEKLRQAWTKQQPINWVRLYREPDHVRFDHSAHVQAGVPCETCHGDVSNMTVMRQASAMKMQDCVACHEAKAAPTDCATCHY